MSTCISFRLPAWHTLRKLDSQLTHHPSSTIARAIQVHGHIDVLINNAAYISIGVIEDLTPADYLAQFTTNLFGTTSVTRALLPHFRAQRSGTCVFISSLSGWIGHAGCSPYASSKFALEGFAESLEAETRHLGIKTLLIEPGRFRTSLLSTGNLQTKRSEIDDYAAFSAGQIEYLASEDRRQPGDPAKLVNVVLDLVRGEGVAEGREVPFRLPLGGDCVDDIKAKCEGLLKVMGEWEEVCRGTDVEG